MATACEKGYSAENDLHNRLLDKEFVVMRAYKSKGPFDLMAACKGFRPLLIEVKNYKAMNDEPNGKVNKKVIKRLKQTVNIRKLYEISQMTDSFPLIAFKIIRKGYLFYRLDYDVGHMVKFKELGSGLRDVLRLPPKFTS